jgi:heptosyltransferase-2
MRILIVAPAWIGDAVLVQPLLSRLHERHTRLTVDVLAPPWTQPVFARMPQVHSTIAAPFMHGELALGERRALGRSLSATGYDQAIVLPNTFKSALVPFFAGIPLRTGFVGELRFGLLNDVRQLDPHALPRMVDRFAALAESRGISFPRSLAPLHLTINDEQRRGALARLGLKCDQPVAVLCPGAEYGPAKRWPAPYFAELGRKLATGGYHVWLAGSPKDAAIGAEIANLSGGACTNLCGRTTLDEAIDLMSCAELVVSNDSGLMHVAAALEKPLTALFGSSSPAFTPPLSPRARVVRLDLPCSPCFKRECPLAHFDCMLKLTPQAVWDQIKSGGNPPT